jgi:hypothetical protein
LKKPFTKKKKKNAGGVAQGVGPEFKSQYRKKKKSVEKTQTPLSPESEMTF